MTPGSLSDTWKIQGSHLSCLCSARAVEAWSVGSTLVEVSSFSPHDVYSPA